MSYASCVVGFAGLISIIGCTGIIDGSRSTRDSTGSGSGNNTTGSPVEQATRTPLRRLTRAQYNNAVRDLLGVTGDFAQAFGPDEDAGGFASNLTALVSATLVDKYQQSAEHVASEAVLRGVASFSPCVPPETPEPVCADQFVSAFGKRAFRRALTQDEVARYKSVYTVGSGAEGNFAAGAELVITAMLQSPHFLYVPELGDGSELTPRGVPLSGYELATRLSLFLVSSIPDDELLAAADQDLLRTDEQVAEQARRLLASPNATDTWLSFFRQWLQVSDLLSTEKDENAYPEFTPDLRQAMHDEITSFIMNVVRDGDGLLDTLLTSQTSTITGPLYSLYGLPEPAAAIAGTATRVNLPAGQRAGLFTLAGVMATYGHPDQSSPVARGLLISDKLLCVTPEPPPNDVDTTVPVPDPSVTTRQRLEEHRTQAACRGCHALMDPYGLTFEMFDGIGRHRTMDGVHPVDSTATLPELGPVTDAIDMMHKLAESEDVRHCMVTQWFRYAQGRRETDADQATISLALSSFERSGYRIPDLLVALASTEGFRYRTPLVP